MGSYDKLSVADVEQEGVGVQWLLDTDSTPPLHTRGCPLQCKQHIVSRLRALVMGYGKCPKHSDGANKSPQHFDPVLEDDLLGGR